MNTFKIANYRPIVIAAVTLALGIFLAGLSANNAIGFFVLLGVVIVIAIASFFLKFKSLKIGAIFLLLGFIIMSITVGVKTAPVLNMENAYFDSMKIPEKCNFILEL